MADWIDRHIGMMAVQRGLLTQARLDECLQEQERLAKKTGRRPPLHEVLGVKGYISVAQVKELIALQARALMVCPKCSKRFSVSTTKPASEPRCPTCNMLLALPELTETVTTPTLPAVPAVPMKPEPKRPSGATPLGKFGRYDLLKKLGEGGMGTVYKAADTQLGRPVALKVLRAERAAESGQVTRFQREARAAAKLRHPNIVQIHDVGVVEDEYYITMDYIEGDSLQAILGTGLRGSKRGEQKRLPLKRGLEILRDIAFALDYAHKQGIVHRDVKPANIIVNPEGTPFLADFGLAKDFKEAVKSGITVEGQFMGTPLYFSPEQAAGETASIGPASDVYSLGVILYQLLAGVVPHEADSFMALAWQIMHAEPALPSKLSATVPKDLEAVCLRAIEKSPRHRYQDARAFGDDIRRYLRGEPVVARAAGPVERLWRRIKRNKWQAVAVACVLVALAGVAVFACVSKLQKSQRMNTKLEDARKLEAEGRFSEARDAFLLVLQEDPKQPDALCGRARVEEALAKESAGKQAEKERAEARGGVEKILREAEKTWWEAANILRNTEIPIEKYHAGVEKALKLYEEAERKLPDYGWTYESRGRLRLTLNDLDGAEADLSKATSLLTPTEAKTAYRSLARVYTERAFELTYERQEKVSRIMSKAAKLVVKIAEATAAAEGEVWADESEERESSTVMVRAFATYAGGNILGAEAILKAALKKHGNADFAYLLAMLAIIRNDTKAQLEYLNKALRIQPRHVRGLIFRGYARYMERHQKEAMKDLDEALRVNPRCAQAFYVRGLAKDSLGDYEGAIADYTEALKIISTSDLALLARGTARRMIGQIDGAIEDFNECIRLDERDWIAYTYRGRTYEEAGLLNSAVEDYDKALSVAPADWAQRAEVEAGIKALRKK